MTSLKERCLPLEFDEDVEVDSRSDGGRGGEEKLEDAKGDLAAAAPTAEVEASSEDAVEHGRPPMTGVECGRRD